LIAMEGAVACRILGIPGRGRWSFQGLFLLGIDYRLLVKS
jgi:hypothetical protein